MIWLTDHENESHMSMFSAAFVPNGQKHNTSIGISNQWGRNDKSVSVSKIRAANRIPAQVAAIFE